MAYQEADIAALIKDSVRALLTARSKIGKGRFTDADANWGAGGDTGALASMHGIRSVWNAVAALAEHPTDIWGVVEPETDSLLDEWISTLDLLDSETYDAGPYVPRSVLARVQTGGERYPYTDTVSWALSTSVLTNFILALPRIHTRYADGRILDRTRARILSTLRALVNAQCRDGGWSWRPGAEEGHLYFTWSAIEGLADFYDYVMGESEAEVGVGKDDGTVRFLESEDAEILNQVRESRERAVAFLAQKYLERVMERGLAPEDVTNGEVALEASDPRVLVYCELYLLESLILAGYDLSGDDVLWDRRDQLEVLYRSIADKYSGIWEPGFSSDPEKSTLQFLVKGAKKTRGAFPTFDVRDPGLWPQLVRTLILYRFYVRQDPVVDPYILDERRGALSLLLENRRPPGEASFPGVWDTEAFNLSITARAIEGLVDCYDYFKLLAHLRRRVLEGTDAQQPLRAPPQNGKLGALLAEAIYPYIESRLHEALAAIRQEPEDARRDLRAQIVEELEAGFRPKVALMARDAVEPLIRQSNSVTPDAVLKLLLPDVADRLPKSPVYDLLRTFSWLSFYVGVRTFRLILQEAVLEQEADGGRLATFRKLDSLEGVKPLADRFRLALATIKDIEMAIVDHPKSDDRPAYDGLIKELLRPAPDRRGRGG